LIKTFQIGARTFRVKKVKECGGSLGRCKSTLGELHVVTTWDGETIPDDSQEQTLWHEIFHAILNEIGQLKLSEDEILVQSVGAMLHQVVNTMK
jgi:hypothetical protein